MYLGLDLRGGVHFLLQVDMKGALTKRLDSTCGRPAHPAARQEPPPRRRQPRRRAHRHQVPRCRDPQTRPASPFADSQPDLQVAEAGDGSEPAPDRHAEAAGPAEDRRIRPQAEHHHPAQPDQRTRRGRAGDPAAGPGPHRGAVAGRAGHRQGQGHPRPHRDPGSPHGGRLAGRTRRRAGWQSAVRHRACTPSAAASRCWSRSRWC